MTAFIGGLWDLTTGWEYGAVAWSRSGFFVAVVGMTIAVFAAMAPGESAAQGLFEAALSGDTEASGEMDAAASAGNAPVGLLDRLGFEMWGNVRATLYAGKVPGEAAAEVKNAYGEAALKVRSKMGRWGDAFAELRLRHVVDTEGRADEAAVREAYVNVYAGPVDVRLGHQIIVWGRADGNNPTDNLTPRDMRTRSPNVDDARLANFVLRTAYSKGIVRWEALWVPVYAPSHFPSFQLDGPISFVDPIYPDTDLSNGTGALRVNLVGESIEGSVSYLYGFATFPGLEVQDFGVKPDKLIVDITFHAYRHHVAGADFATTLGDVGLRGEAALRVPEKEDDAEYIPHPDVAYVMGLDYLLPGEVSLIAQYVGRAVLEWDEPFEAATPPEGLVHAKTLLIAGQTKELSHAAMVRLQWTLLHETMAQEVAGLYNVSTEEWMARAQVTYDIADALELFLGGEVFMGPDEPGEETLYGMIDEVQSAGFVEVRGSF